MFSYSRKLNVSAEEIYDVLIQQVLAEAESKSGKKHTVEDLDKGIKYKSNRKLAGKMEEASVSVRKPVENKKVSFTYFIKGVTYEFSYNITPIDDGHCTMEYLQDTNPAQQENFFTNFMNKRNTKAKFINMERYIIKQRKESVKN